MKFVFVLVALALVVAVDAGVSVNNPFYCYFSDPVRPQVQMHSVRTSYEAVRRTAVNPSVSSCNPTRFWFLSRHGGRLPETPLLQRMLDFADSSIQVDIVRNSDYGRTTLCRQDVELIRNWVRHPNITLEWESLTTVAGWTAMQNIARRYQQMYPQLLPPTYNQNQILFRHAITPRSHSSIRAFADGLYGDNSWQNVVFQPIPENDWFLRPIDFCPQFREEVADQFQQEAFERGPEFEQMMFEVNLRLGLRGANQLSVDRVLTMWEWCRFETASQFELSSSDIGEISVWCAPFTVAHHAVLEYHQDLGYYHFTGYGVRNQRLIENLNCGLVQDMLVFIQSPLTAQTARIFGTDSQMVQSFLVTLGAVRDNEPLHQHNYAQQSFRHWKTSFITPNAANIAVIRHDCPGGDNDIVFYLNEGPILLPGCDIATGICKQSVLVNRLQRFIGANCAQFFCSSN